MTDTTLAPARLRTITALSLPDHRRFRLRLANQIADRAAELTADQVRDIGVASALDVDRLTGGDLWHRHYGLVAS